MEKRLEKKLRKVLAKEGLDEEQVNKIVDEVDAAKSEEDAPDGTNPEEAAANNNEEENPETPTPEEPEEEEEGGDPAPEEPEPTPAPAPEEPVPPVEEPVPPADGSIEAVLNEFNPNPEGEVPPAEGQPVPPVPPAPVENPEVVELRTQLEEEKKANEGLKARLDSLEDALRKAGILEGQASSPAVGVEQNIVPEDKKDGGAGVLDDVLSSLNKKNI